MPVYPCHLADPCVLISAEQLVSAANRFWLSLGHKCNSVKIRRPQKAIAGAAETQSTSDLKLVQGCAEKASVGGAPRTIWDETESNGWGE